jgi:hypothetical protein
VTRTWIERIVWRGLILVALLGCILPLAGCIRCNVAVEAAGAFLEDSQNRICQTDVDCMTVSTGCHTYDSGLCGQALLSRTAAESDRWLTLQKNLLECEGEDCMQCMAALLPRCTDGLCGGKRPPSAALLSDVDQPRLYSASRFPGRE